MDWNDLPFFITIANHGTLAGAARELGVNHSTVFRRINTFEKKLGVRVFERLPEGYVLTEAGEEILAHARQAHESIHTLERTAAGRDFQPTGHISITAPQNIATAYLAPCIAAFRHHCPGIQIEVDASDKAYDLSRRDADMALRASSQPPEYLIGRKVVDLNWYLCASQPYLDEMGGLDGSGRSIGKVMEKETDHLTEYLNEHRLIGAAGDLRRIPPFVWLHKQVPTANMVSLSDSLDTIAAMACTGLGIAFLPSDLHRPSLKRLHKVENVDTAQLWILTHPDLRNVVRIKTFSQFLLEYLQNHAGLAEGFSA
ncbi:MAG: LysR family transcriptional regulator [Ectothiorhodospiraceae bacterium]|nr:LysR family transcriptional regulator [Ectothiorhodospiraceae bacterium]